MKISTLILRNIIKEELDYVMNEFTQPDKIPSPESLGLVLPQKLKTFIDGIDLEKLVSLAKEYRGHRTLEEAQKMTPQQKWQWRQKQRRRQRSEEIPPEELLADEPFEEDTRASVKIVTDLVALINDSEDTFAKNTTLPEYRDGLAELIRRHEEASDGQEKEFLGKWIEIFEYAKSWPLFKKQFPKMSDFLKKRKEEVLDIVDKGKQLPTVAKDKAREKWDALGDHQGTVAFMLPMFTAGLFGLICAYIAEQLSSGIGDTIGFIGLCGFLILALFSIIGREIIDDFLRKK